MPVDVTGFGADVLEAVPDLDALTRGERSDGPRKVDELRAPLRLAYVEGADTWARQELGRPLATGELERVIDRFPGR